MAVLVAIAWVTNAVLSVAHNRNPDWMEANATAVSVGQLLFQTVAWIVVVMVLAGSRSSGAFVRQAGLRCPPTVTGWLAAWIALGIGMLGVYFSSKGFIPSHDAADYFYQQGDATKWFFLGYAILLAPFSEELVGRGFLYRAFRGTFNVVPSTILVLCVDMYFHWGLVVQSFYAFVCLATLGVLLCAVREKTRSVWNCMLCHAIYNATQGFPWPLCAAALLALLALCCAFLFLKRRLR